MGNMNFDQRTKLLMALVEMANVDKYIPYTASEIAARVEEPIGRSISTTSLRPYMRAAGFTWKDATGRSAHSPNQDRVVELARIISDGFRLLGISSTETVMQRLSRVCNKKRVEATHVPWKTVFGEDDGDTR